MPKWLIFIYTALSLVLSPVTATAQEQFVAGKDYVIIETPVRTSDPKKIEVTEVFWYGCPHCNDFRPVFEQWKKQQPEDINIQHSPAMWNKRMVTHAKIFYTSKALGKLDVMHKDIFDAMHLKRQKLLNTSQIALLFEKHGVNKEKFEKTFNSFGVRSLVQQAESRARGYGITGTPELVVNGKYRLSARLVGSQAKMLQVVNFLVEKERAALSES